MMNVKYTNPSHPVRPLVLTDEARARAAQVVAYARERPFSFDMVRKMASGEIKLRVGDDPGFRCEIPVGFICCYSEEFQPIYGEDQPCVRLRHLSISVVAHSTGSGQAAGRMPNPVAAVELAKMFGFPAGELGKTQVDHTSIEELADGRKAINLWVVMEEIETGNAK